MKAMRQIVPAAMVFAVLAGSTDAPVLATTDSRDSDARAFEVVPCLLPARVRRLGGIVYPERRQLIQATARACELRGGEYTVYDRSTPEASVAFFRPLAEAGDPVAQTQLGEVFQYLFATPRHADAALWYQRAVEQGDTTAMRRLAHLHEHGLGVPRNTLLATNLWRQATGLGDELVLASEAEAARTAAEARIAELAAQLTSRSAEADSLRIALAEASEEQRRRRQALASLGEEVQRLSHDLAAARSGGGDGRVIELESELRAREQRLADQQHQLADLEATLVAQQAGLQAAMRRVELENQRLQAELEQVAKRSAAELAAAREELAARDRELEELRMQRQSLEEEMLAREAAVVALDKRLAALRAAASSEAAAREELAVLGAEREQQAAALAQARADVEGLREALAARETETRSLRAELDLALDERHQAEARLAQLQSELVRATEREVAAARERDSLRDEVAVLRSSREELAARIAASRGVTSARDGQLDALREQLRTREAELAKREQQLATADASARRYSEELERLRSQMQVQVASRSAVEALPDTSKLRLPGDLRLGRYHALVIGNNNYQHLRKLSFAHNDARAVHEVLTQRYRFQSELLLDATRSDIFQRVDALKDTLKPEDSLLIYYAGHGAEDGTDSYWMGVDALSASPGAQEMFGVSSSALARWLAMLPANHVLVIADSCYSGRGIVTSGGIKLRQEEIEKNMRFYLQNRARTVLTSGSVVPVPDGGDGKHSVFTGALVGLLNQNRGVLFDNDLYAHLKERVRYGADSGVVAPEPIFGRIEISGGHGSGQFAFLHPNVLRRL